MKKDLTKPNRLESLDILRGADLFLLLIIGPVVQTFLYVNQDSSLDWIRNQMEHVPWEGFVLWDIIMPLFMFMSGITIPFSMAKYKSGVKPQKDFYLKLLKRFALLFFLGWIVQGQLLYLSFRDFHPYANTLQAIAVGYVASAIAFVLLNRKWRVTFAIICFALYWLVFLIFGDMNLDPENNIAMVIDKAVLGGHRDGTIWSADGTYTYDARYQYTWILSSLNFIVTVLLGCFAGEILKSEKSSAQKSLYLTLGGILLIIAGLAISPLFPIIKKIWSSSMTLYSGGICFLLMAIFYYLIDHKGYRKGLGWLKYFGMNSIIAYCIGEVINFSSVSASLLFGLEQYAGNYYSVIISFANAALLFIILRILYKNKIFLRV